MRYLLRKFNLIKPRQQVAGLAIFCRGKSIGREELFAYTNGHFLVDEQHQLDRRYLKFNLDALLDVAARSGGTTSPITAIEKLEGGFSKALVMKKEDGNQVIVKIPCHIAGPAFLTTASEVGALEYVRNYTSIPVPRVLSWSCDDSNPVGAEYIIMEKAAGVPLFEQWPKMSEIDKLELIKSLTQLEAQLSGIKFPAYGGLYLQADAQRLKRVNLDKRIDPRRLFCVGPSPDRSFGTDIVADVGPQYGPQYRDEKIERGPWSTISDFGISIAKRELSRISTRQLPKSRPGFYQGGVEEKTQLLHSTIKLMRTLDSNPLLVQSAQPTLWHTDLHMGNIFVSPVTSAQIVSFIDFQSLSVLPFFLQAQWPVFLKPPLNYTKGLTKPKLPEDFSQLDEDGKAGALQEWTQSKLAKAYEVSTFLANKPAHNAMHIPRVFRELFTRCGEVSEAGLVPLRECLFEIYRNWSSLGFTGECPYSFNDEEINTHNRQFPQYLAWNEVQKLAQECLDTDPEGWIHPQVDIVEKKKQNKKLLSIYIERVSGEKSPEEARAEWPFPEEE